MKWECPIDGCGWWIASEESNATTCILIIIEHMMKHIKNPEYRYRTHEWAFLPKRVKK